MRTLFCSRLSASGQAKPKAHVLQYARRAGLLLVLLVMGCGAVGDDGVDTDGGVMTFGSDAAQVNDAGGAANDDGGSEGNGGTGGMGGVTDNPYDLPPSTPCDVLAANWPRAWVDFEDEVLLISNEMRAQSQDCRSGGQFPPARPLETNELLVCAARRHSLDMIQRNFFDHLDPDGVGPDVRAAATGYRISALGENIAAGSRTPAAVVQGWMDSDGHCRNIMQGVFEQLGVGYVVTPNGQFKHFWTQVFGTQ